MAGATFDPVAGRLGAEVAFERGSRFACPECDAADCSVYDTVERSWRHMDFFQHEMSLTARVPRVTCQSCGVRTVPVPWARPQSGFTLLFEALVCSLAPHMTVAALARHVREHHTRIWQILGHYVERARAGADYSKVRRVGIDETTMRPPRDLHETFEIDHPHQLTPGAGLPANVRRSAMAEPLKLHRRVARRKHDHTGKRHLCKLQRNGGAVSASRSL